MRSNNSFISAPGRKIRAGGHCHISASSPDQKLPPTHQNPINAKINVEFTTMKKSLESYTEAELVEMFVICQHGDALHIVLAKTVHQKSPTVVIKDNTTVNGFVNYNNQKKRYRTIEIGLYWVWDRVRQGHFLLYWTKGKYNLVDSFTKNHQTKHHHEIRSTYLVHTSDTSKH